MSRSQFHAMNADYPVRDRPTDLKLKSYTKNDDAET